MNISFRRQRAPDKQRTADVFQEGCLSEPLVAMDVDTGERTLALGSFGNLLYIDRERNVIMAQLATQRVKADIPIKRLEFAMLVALPGELDI